VTVAWCDDCDRLIEDEDLGEGGTCPRCGAVLEEEASGRRIPWTFKGMLVAFVIYLGYRGYQGVTWLAHHL
jgi:uncharacterized paraquat-inducible protein A